MSTILSAPMADKRAAGPAEIEMSPKRQKTSELTSTETIQRSELDTALALASLALDSPKQAPAHSEQTRESDGSPKATSVGEERSEPAPVTPISTPNKRKRVHFSNGVPEPTGAAASPPVSRLIRRRRPMLVPQHQRAVVMPPPYPYPYPHQHHHRMAPPMAPPHPGCRHPLMYRQWMPMQARMPPPPPQPPVMAVPGSNTWICDFCNNASFSSFQEACAHENVCKHRKTNFQQARQPEDNRKAQNEETSRDEGETAWFSGCVALSVEPADIEWLSELNCFIRKNCIQAFSATHQDVLKTSKRGRIVIDQVGIRCKFCVHRPLKDKAVAAVSYPTSMAGIYESVKRWQRVHLPACLDVSDENQAMLDKLQNDTVWVPTTRQYWTDSARAIGMVDTNDGIRFNRDPAVPPPANWMPETTKPSSSPGAPSSADNEALVDQQQPGGFICSSEDKEMIPPYVFYLMRQVEPCYFTEADRFVARSKGPVGFAGFQCRHCAGHAGLGKYFPLNSKALSTNSTSQNIHAHILKCRKSSKEVKDGLVFLKNEKLKSPRLVPGWRKTFFERVWERLHGDKVNLN
jgi:hypothetical protein